MESGESVGSLFKKISNNDTCDNIMETRQAEFQDEGYFVDFFKEIEQYVMPARARPRRLCATKNL